MVATSQTVVRTEVSSLNQQARIYVLWLILLLCPSWARVRIWYECCAAQFPSQKSSDLCWAVSMSCPSDRRDSSRFTKRDQAPASFVPQDQLHALQTLPQRDPADFAEFRVIL